MTIVELARSERPLIEAILRELPGDGQRVFHAWRAPRVVGLLAGSLKSASYHPSQRVAVCWISARSAGGDLQRRIGDQLLPRRSVRNNSAIRRASGARPTIVSTNRRVSSSAFASTDCSGRCNAKRAMNAGAILFGQRLLIEHQQEMQPGLDAQAQHARFIWRRQVASAGARPSLRAASASDRMRQPA